MTQVAPPSFMFSVGIGALKAVYNAFLSEGSAANRRMGIPDTPAMQPAGADEKAGMTVAQFLMVVGVPEIGPEALAMDAAKIGEATTAVEATSKVFSPGKQALVDMAKTDKKLGMSSADMQAYKDLNKTLPDPFPANKVRGPEAHSSGLPSSQQPHGHVGPVDHIPIKDKTP